MKPRRRTILNMLLLLAAGATLNVAVAWGCVIRVPRPKFMESTGLYEPRHRPGYMRLQVALGFVNVSQFGPGMNVHMIDFPPDISESALRRVLPPSSSFVNANPAFDAQLMSCREQFAGWPCYSLFCSWTSPWFDERAWKQNPGVFPDQVQVGVLPIPYGLAKRTHASALPILPLWPGFAVNTLFYAGVLWVMFATPFALRRMIRKRLGRCPQCAYPIGQSPVCNEYGAAVIPRFLCPGRESN